MGRKLPRQQDAIYWVRPDRSIRFGSQHAMVLVSILTLALAAPMHVCLRILRSYYLRLVPESAERLHRALLDTVTKYVTWPAISRLRSFQRRNLQTVLITP